MFTESAFFTAVVNMGPLVNLESMARAKRPRSTSSLAQDLIDTAIEQGWRVEYKPSGHICFWPIDKNHNPITTASTPSDPRGPLNLRAQLRRAGLKI